MRLFHRGLILVMVPLLLESVLMVSLFGLLYEAGQDRLNETKYRKFSSEVSHLITSVVAAPHLLTSSFVYGSPRLYLMYEDEVANIEMSLETVHELGKGIPEIPQEKFDELDQAVGAVVKQTKELSALAHNPLKLFSKFMSRRSHTDKMRDTVYKRLDGLLEISQRMTENAQAKLAQTRRKQFAILGIGLVSNLLMCILLGIFYKRGILDRINTIKRNTKSLVSEAQIAEEIGGNDEIGQFDRAFHKMLVQLRTAAHHERELFENASDVICVLDKEGRFERINPASEKEWGIKPYKLFGSSLGDLLDLTDGHRASDVIDAAIAGAGPSTFEAVVKHADGSRRTCLWSVYWSVQDQRLYCIVHDITESKRLASEKKQFLNILSADMKSPLLKISQGLNGLVDSLHSANDDVHTKLERSSGNVGRLLGLVDELIVVSKDVPGETELQAHQESTADLVMRAVAEVEPLAAAKSIKLETTVCDSTAWFDQPKLLQVLLNLLSNAIKFSPENSTVCINSTRRDDSTVLIEVIDHGRGVPESHRDSIFEKFLQVEAADGGRKTGTGLGLPICKSIVVRHSGDIGVRGNADGSSGSTFWFTVPCSRPNAPPPSSVRIPVLVLPEESHAPLEPELKVPRGLFDTSLRTKGIVLVGIPALIGLTLVSVLTVLLLQTESNRAQELHMRKIATTTSEVAKDMLYIANSEDRSATDIEWNQMIASCDHVYQSEAKLKELAAVDPHVQQLLDDCDPAANAMKSYGDRMIAAHERNDQEEMSRLKQEGVRHVGHLLKLIVTMRDLMAYSESKEFVTPEKELKLRYVQFAFLAVGGIVNLIISALLAYFFAISISGRILIMANNAERLASDEKLNPPIGGRDELFLLDKSFREAADRLAEARQKERAVFDNCKDVLCVVSKTGRFLSVNSAVVTNWGYRRRQLVDEELSKVVLPEDLEQCHSSLARLSDDSIQCRIRRSDGQVLYTSWALSRKSEKETIFCIVYDITEKVEVEQLRQDVLGMVSHDLRTPLSSIVLFAQLIDAGAYGDVSPESSAHLTAITKNVEWLMDLVTDILDLEKFEAGRLQLIVQTTSGEDVVGHLKERLKDFAGEVVATGDLESLFDADQERLARALTNITKYLVASTGNPSGELRIDFTASQFGMDITIRTSVEGYVEAASTDLSLRLSAAVVQLHGSSLDIAFDPAEKTVTAKIPQLRIPSESSANI